MSTRVNTERHLRYVARGTTVSRAVPSRPPRVIQDITAAPSPAPHRTATVSSITPISGGRNITDLRTPPSRLSSPVAPVIVAQELHKEGETVAETPKTVEPIDPKTLAQKNGFKPSRTGRSLKEVLKGKWLYGLSALVFTFGAGVAIQGLYANKAVTEQVQVLAAKEATATGDGEIPTETNPVPGSIDSYKVGPALPRVISIPKIGVEARVLRVDVNSKNEIGTPGSIHDTGWYMGSSLPGESGAMVIDGHRSGPTKDGVFRHIGKLQKGDEITVQRGDATVFRYRVESVESVAVGAVDMQKLLSPIQQGTNGLNLITCSGAYNSATHDFADRTIVYATQI